VQAPHSAMPHPNFVPVMSNTSRNTQRSVTIDIDDVCLWVDFDAECHGTFSSTSSRHRQTAERDAPMQSPSDQEA
jgi:hypothetical protein